jgi:2,5-dichloro-2,5-cyclohexadiene-1,4-diol dehydrogenase 1
MVDLSGKSLIITGGASGIGRAAALSAARSGAKLTIVDLNEAGGRDVCKQVQALGAEAQFVLADVSRVEDVKAMVGAAVAMFGRLDGAFNNAGIANANLALTDIPDETFERMQAINLTGVFLCMKYEVLEMLRTGGGAIVNTSSTAAINANPNMAEYSAAKSGLLGLTRAAALDLGRKGVRVNAILPGATRTEMLLAATARSPGLEEHLVSRQPMGRLCEPSEVAVAALWLLSDEASAVTGISMPVDGGLSNL